MCMKIDLDIWKWRFLWPRRISSISVGNAWRAPCFQPEGRAAPQKTAEPFLQSRNSRASLTHWQRGKDSNSRSPSRGRRSILGEEKGPEVDQMVSRDAVPFHGGPVVRIRLPPPGESVANLRSSIRHRKAIAKSRPPKRSFVKPSGA